MSPATQSPRTWEDKVHAVISKLARAAYEQANTDRNGRRYKRTRQYSLPEEALRLVEVLGWHDRQAAEVEAKTLMEGLRRARVKID